VSSVLAGGLGLLGSLVQSLVLVDGSLVFLASELLLALCGRVF
jgi:hypothetical protein